MTLTEYISVLSAIAAEGYGDLPVVATADDADTDDFIALDQHL